MNSDGEWVEIYAVLSGLALGRLIHDEDFFWQQSNIFRRP